MHIRTLTAAFLALTLIQGPAQAEGAAEACRSFSGLAETIMTHRQNGTPMSDMIDLVATESGPIKDAAQAIVVAAYEKNRYSTKEIQNDVISDFSNDVYLTCFQSMN